MERESAEQEELTQLRYCIHNSEWNSCPSVYKAVRLELWKRVVHQAHEGHHGVVKSKQRLSSKVWWPGIAKYAP